MTDDQSINDLDALVLAEIESASGGHVHRRSDARSLKRHEADGLIKNEARAAQPREVTRIHGDDRAYHNQSGEEAEFLDQPLEMDQQEQDELPPGKLFTPEEEAFMHRAVGFLSGRENGDVILGQIWERLTQSHPESFYVPQLDGHDESTGSDNAEGGREDGASANGQLEQ